MRSTRIVALERAAPQARTGTVRSRQCLVWHPLQLITVLHRYLTTFALAPPQGPARLKVLQNALADPASDAPGPVRGARPTSRRARL